jgi:hypothetical protein
MVYDSINTDYPGLANSYKQNGWYEQLESCWLKIIGFLLEVMKMF